MPQTLFHYSSYLPKIELIRLTLYHWQPCVSKFRNIRKGGLYKISRKISNSAFLILQEILKIDNFLQNNQRDVRLANIAFLILQEILQSRPFLMSRKFET